MPLGFGDVECPACKGSGLTQWGQDCDPCHGKGYQTPEEQKAYRPPGEEIVKKASDGIVPRVQDNPFSQEALDKVIRSGRDKSMRRMILNDLHAIYPEGMSSSQFEERYDWLHQSCSAALTGLHQSGLINLVSMRFNRRGNREGIYALSGLAKGAWDG